MITPFAQAAVSRRYVGIGLQVPGLTPWRMSSVQRLKLESTLKLVGW
jgi:hypothetical protein